MEYRSSSINEVLGRIVRNTRIQDSSYLTDAIEWIPEAMGMLRTKVKYRPKWIDLPVHFHNAQMPCGLSEIRAIEYNGRRLKYADGVRSVDAPWLCHKPATRVANPTPYLTVPIARETSEGGTIYESTAIQIQQCTSTSIPECMALPLCDQWYQTYLDVIQTSIKEGTIRVHYYAMNTDDQGLPLIPDNEDYKEALYWYVREKMVGAGWTDEVYDSNIRMAKFELHASRALGQIRYPHLDEMEMKVNASTRFIPPANYFENFFNTPNPEPFYGRYDGGPL